MKNIKRITSTIVMLLTVAFVTYAQNGFTSVRIVKAMKVTVKEVNSTNIMIPMVSPNERYIAENMPEELKKDGLLMTISGDVGKVPANARMMGTPFKLTCVTITKAEQVKYKLKKKKWNFK